MTQGKKRPIQTEKLRKDGDEEVIKAVSEDGEKSRVRLFPHALHLFFISFKKMLGARRGKVECMK